MDNIVEDDAMRQIKFSVPGQPFGKQRPKFSRVGQYVKTYTPDKTVSYESLVKVMYQLLMTVLKCKKKAFKFCKFFNAS